MPDACDNLFVLPNGEPMVFLLKRSRGATKIRTLILAGGGKCTSQQSQNCILLASPGTIVTSKNFIHSQYIMDCVTLKKRLGMNAYAVEPFIPVPELPAAVSEPPGDNSRRNGPARRPFSISESAAIWNYIVSNKLENQIHKRSIWKTMEAAKLTSHSAESMRSHFRQVLALQFPDQSACGAGLRGSSSRNRRQEFTEQEDRAIIDHIIQNKCFSAVSSRKFWRSLERAKVTAHSAESMRSRFRRRLLTRILSELKDVMTHTEYEEAAHALLRLESHTTTNSVQSWSGETEDYTIEETTIDESEITFPSPNFLSPGLTPQNSATPSNHSTFHHNTSLLHSTPRKIFRKDTSVQTSEISETVVRSAQLIDSGTIPREEDPNTNHSHTTPDFVNELIQSSDLMKTPLQAYLLVTMTNGSITEAKNFLQTGRRRPDLPLNESPPLWTPDADAQLASCDLDVLRQLIRQYGSDEVCQRIAYLSDM